MRNLNEILELARNNNEISVRKFECVNELLSLVSEIKCTGVGLASGEYKEKDEDEIYECIILLDNLQFFYFKQNVETGVGTYYICNTLEEIEEKKPRFLLIHKAKDTIENYPS